MSWTRVMFRIESGRLDDLESHLWDLGAVSVTVTDPEDNPIYEPPPGETPLWDELVVCGLFPAEEDIQHVVSAVELAGYPLLCTEELADRHWEREWMTDFEPMRFGSSLWICPTGFSVSAEAARVVRLDPGLAFGTGTHATTRLCLEWIDAFDFTAARVLDYGCGSGILGIAALRCGAHNVVAVDNDPQALTATLDNADRNGVADRIVAVLPDAVPEGEFDVVLANILAGPLVELADVLTRALRPGGSLVLSGILTSQQAWVETAYQDRVTLTGQQEHEGWVCLHGRR